MERSGGGKKNAVMQTIVQEIPMVKHYSRRGTSGWTPRITRIGSTRGDGTSGDACGTKLRQLGKEKKRKKTGTRTPKDKRDLVHWGTWSRETFHVFTSSE